MASPQDTLLLTTAAADLEHAGTILRAGGLVAMPTETVYGLAANALDADAVESIFIAKERPKWDPLIVHVADEAMLALVTKGLCPTARLLADAFWPGPLTMLLPRQPSLPQAVTAGRDLVGVRMPAHPVATALIRAAGVPLAAPSANRFGHISPTSAQHVLEELNGRIAAVIDGGPSSIGVESTVLDPAGNPIILYRHGGISAVEASAATGREVKIFVPDARGNPASMPSPGTGIRHYAPRARLVLVESEAELQNAIAELGGNQVGVMMPQGWQAPANLYTVFPWERWTDVPALARTLYDGLRTLDSSGVSTVVCPVPAAGEDKLREALRDRLRKAAMPRA